MKANDIPVSNLELDRFYGIDKVVDTSAADKALREIRSINPAYFTEDVAAVLIRAIASRVASSGWAHLEWAQGAIERLDDASDLIGD